MTWGLRARLFSLSLAMALLATLGAWLAAPWAVERLVSVARAELLAAEAAALASRIERDAAPSELLVRQGAEHCGARVLLVDAAGSVLADSHPATVLPGLPAAEAGWRVLRDGSGNPHLLVEIPLGPGSPRGASVRLLERLPGLDATVWTARFSVLVLALLGLAAAAALSVLAGRWNSQLLGPLALAARQLAAGAPATFSGGPRPAELGELGRAVDQLAGSLLSALQKLRSERDLLGSVLATLQEGVLVLDRQGRIELVNPALREMLLLPPELQGRSPLEVLRSSELQQLLVRAREAPASAEFDLAGLKPRRVVANAAALTGPEGGLLVTFVDVTNVRRLETMRREFVANVSHELRTPVASIRSAAETLEAALGDPPAATRFVGIIGRNAERMNRLVDDLLDLARIEAKELKLHPEPLEVRAAVEQTFALFRERAERRRVRIETAIDTPLAVRADRRALEQVLANLVDNAVKYCPEGGRVVVRGQVQGDQIRVGVEDSGPGIDPRHLPRLFERFYRVDAGRSRELGGTGLGLSIVKHLCEAMGGGVGVESEPGKGSIFLIYLPAAHP
jgi:two-component system phosphate regulon sensor histidine kinase PhoR